MARSERWPEGDRSSRKNETLGVYRNEGSLCYKGFGWVEEVPIMVFERLLPNDTRLQALLRQYCALLGDDPDDVDDWGEPNHQVNMAYLQAAFMALEMAGIDVFDQISRLPKTSGLLTESTREPRSCEVIPLEAYRSDP